MTRDRREHDEDQADEQPPVFRLFRPPATLTEARRLTAPQWSRS
ncbi:MULTISPECIES: hypothetical protein [Streptomyces]|nr:MULTISPECIES: hypothetical protein [Streptomyces]